MIPEKDTAAIPHYARECLVAQLQGAMDGGLPSMAQMGRCPLLALLSPTEEDPSGLRLCEENLTTNPYRPGTINATSNCLLKRLDPQEYQARVASCAKRVSGLLQSLAPKPDSA